MGSPVTHATGMLGAVLAPMQLGEDIHLIDRWDPDARPRRHARGRRRRGNRRVGVPREHPRPSRLHPRARTAHPPGRSRRRAGTARARGTRRRARHRDRPRLRIDRAPVGHRLRRSTIPPTSGTAPTAGPMPGVEIRLVDDDGVDGRRRATPARSGRAARTCASATPTPRSPRSRSTPTAGTAPATWACVDADGFLTITDRVNDVIIRGGENISAAEIEEAIAALPQVAEVAVVAAPDERLGEHACAVVRLAPGRELDRPARHHRARSQRVGLARQKWPEELRVVPDFPRTASGKVRKVDLRQQLRAERPRHQARPVRTSAPEPFRTIDVAPIAGALGAEITGVDLARDLPDEIVARDPARVARAPRRVLPRPGPRSGRSSSRSPAASAIRSSTRSCRASTATRRSSR